MKKRTKIGLLSLMAAAFSTVVLGQSFTTFVNARVTTQLDLQGTLTANGSTGTSGQVLTSNGASDITWTTPAAAVTGANPTASIGLTAVNGVAGTFMRSDAAPLLSQSIVPTWTGMHIFAATTGGSVARTGTTRWLWNTTDGPTNEKIYEFRGDSTGQFFGLTRTDADGSGATWLALNRTGTAVDSIALTSTALTWNGSAMVNVASAPTWTGTHTFGNATIGIRLDSTVPTMQVFESDAAADEKLYRSVVSGGDFLFGTRTDANGAGTDFMVVGRTGTTVDSIALTSTALTWNGSGVCVASGVNCPAAGFANPTASVGLTAVNGVATTAMRSDAAPALSQAIAPTWTNTHTFAGATAWNVSSVNPFTRWSDTNEGTDEKNWVINVNAGALSIQTLTDAVGAGATAISIDRTGTAIDSIALAGTSITLNGVASSDFARLSQSNTFTAAQNFTAVGTGAQGSVHAASTSPVLLLKETDGAANNQNWLINAGAEALHIAAFNDAGSVGTDAIAINRTGTTIDSVALAGTAVTVNGSNVCRQDGVGCPTFVTKWAGAFIQISGGACTVPNSSAKFNIPSCSVNATGNFNVEIGWSAATLPSCTVSLSGASGFIRPGPVDANTVNVITRNTSDAAADLNFYIMCFGD